jgi:hypothetical protein
MIAVIAAGAHLDDKLRKFFWEVDGMISLLTEDDYREMLQSIGFFDITFEDVTHLALDSSEKIEAALKQNRDEILRTEGDDIYRGWLEVGDICCMRRTSKMNINPPSSLRGHP